MKSRVVQTGASSTPGDREGVRVPAVTIRTAQGAGPTQGCASSWL
jgi:hypothetical protein